MRLHLLGLPHTQTTNEFSHCAFTGKVKRFSPMMQSVGYEVIHYGVEGAYSGAKYNINVMMYDEWMHIRSKLFKEIYGDRDSMPSDFIGDLANTGNELYRTFNTQLKKELYKNLDNDDIICLPFGHGHEGAISEFPHAKVETGIGYPNAYQPYKVFESYAWYHYTIGRQDITGNDYNWVIPNYFDVSEWDFVSTPKDYVAYFGRISDGKGLSIVYEVARARPDLNFVICGQGDPEPYLRAPNIIYKPPIHGTERSEFLGNAMAVLMPTRYVEPFGGVTVEAELCGTPVIGSSYGSFTETIEHGMTGYRCHTLGDYLAALEKIEAGTISREYVRNFAATRYDMYNLAHDYDRVFKQVSELKGLGWYSYESSIGPVTRAVPLTNGV
jgi:glycosyltransferase involved in cell wall biosynthesis